MNRQTLYEMKFVLYSPHELVNSDGAGFWSNDEGWVEFRAATQFTVETVPLCKLQMSDGPDAKWLMWEPEPHAAQSGAAAQPVQPYLRLAA
jgi:hypothetical protein